MKPAVFDGISFHCYAGNAAAERSLLLAHPETTVWFTECSGVSRSAFAQDLMWQARHLLLEAPLNGAKSVLLWNLALDPNGGPHNGGCDGCRGLLTIAKHDGVATVTRNVEYYLLGQVAPFVHPGAMQVEVSSSPEQGVLANGYRNVDGTMVVVALNSSPKDVTVALKVAGAAASYKMQARSIATFRWGVPKPVLATGAYRLAVASESGVCLAAGETLGQANCGSGPEQLWTVSAASGGRVEIRNVATAQVLTADAAGKLRLLKVDGDHAAPMSVEAYADEVCLGASGGKPCGPAAKVRFLPPAMPVIADKSGK
jgi:glucosylceramidase